MNTIYNMFILNLKYTLPFVLGIYVLELIAKTLCSAILGHLNIPDFWVKLNLKKGDESIDDPLTLLPTGSDLEAWQRMSNESYNKILLKRSGSDLDSIIRGFK